MRKNFGSKVATATIWLLAALSVAMLVRTLLYGAETFTIAELVVAKVELDVALRFDGVSALAFALVATLAAVIGQYALRYLDGDPQQWRFVSTLGCVVAAVSLMVLSTNLAVFFFAWLGMSWGLHRLLLLHPHRDGAVYAARKKLLVSRVGDCALLAACALLFSLFGTLTFESIFVAADAGTLGGSETARLTLAGLLIAAGAMAKSVQLPFHFWLPETMETPAPVSALMHAGVINAGGLLVIKLSPLLGQIPAAGALLALVGAATAVYGALVMATQSTIKAKLAYSTISQMGMMMFACGLGAYGLALFHIVAHSLYKARAFLSTGTLVAERRIAAPTRVPSLGATTMIVALAFSLLIGGHLASNGSQLPALTYAAALALGLAHGLVTFPLATFRRAPAAALCTLAALAGAMALCFALEAATSGLVGFDAKAGASLPLSLATLGVFAAGAYAARLLGQPGSSLGRRLHVWLWNGGYLGTATTRLLARLWPA